MNTAIFVIGSNNRKFPLSFLIFSNSNLQQNGFGIMGVRYFQSDGWE
jgi:hypothetical protein